MKSIILRTGARYVCALMLVFSLYMLLRGHNQPGGGFIGGLIGGTAFVLYAVGCSVSEARRALRVQPQNVAFAGLGVALLAALLPALTGGAFFEGRWLFVGGEVPGIYSKGALPISSVLLFDVGVYLVVFGSVVTLVFAMEEEI